SNEFDAKATSFLPADFCQFNAERWTTVRHKDFHLEVCPRFDHAVTHNRTARHRDIVDCTFSDERIAGKYDGEPSGDAFAITNLHQGRLPTTQHYGAVTA